MRVSRGEKRSALTLFHPHPESGLSRHAAWWSPHADGWIFSSSYLSPRTKPFKVCSSRQGSQIHFSFGPLDFSCFLRSSATYLKGRLLRFTQRLEEFVKGRVLCSLAPSSTGIGGPRFLNTPICSLSPLTFSDQRLLPLVYGRSPKLGLAFFLHNKSRSESGLNL